jgi:hypothetical protein
MFELKQISQLLTSKLLKILLMNKDLKVGNGQWANLYV